MKSNTPFKSNAHWLLFGLMAIAIFPRPASGEIPGMPATGLEDRVAFWEKVFTLYGKDDLIIHDRERVNLIYDVVDERSRDAGVRRVRDLLGEVRRNISAPGALSSPARSLYDAIEAAGVRMSAGDIAVLEGRIHVQRGIKERFRDGIVRSGRYLHYIQEVFESEGVPAEIGLLPLVESSFENVARSHAGAVGIWQFMPGTARLFMTVSRGRDDRLNPAAATRGAARLLKGNYERLQSWPLAITAYNHGTAGMMRARSAHGADMATIIRNYDGRTFGYASKNFYAEFLAAVNVYSNYEHHFGPLALDAPQSFGSGTTLIASRAPIEAGSGTQYRVRPGDTLSLIAARHGTTIREIMAINHMPSDRIFAGETLLVSPAPTAVASAREYQVRWGDTLSNIARQFGLEMRQLMEANGLGTSTIYAGQVLVLP